MRKLLSGYARIFNKKYQRSGSLFRQKTKAKNVAAADLVVKKMYSLQDYCSHCFNYLHQNPVITGLVKLASEWEYSSCCDYAGLRNGTLCNKELAAQYCGYDARNFSCNNDKRNDEFQNSFLKEND